MHIKINNKDSKLWVLFKNPKSNIDKHKSVTQ